LSLPRDAYWLGGSQLPASNRHAFKGSKRNENNKENRDKTDWNQNQARSSLSKKEIRAMPEKGQKETKSFRDVQGSVPRNDSVDPAPKRPGNIATDSVPKDKPTKKES